MIEAIKRFFEERVQDRIDPGAAQAAAISANSIATCALLLEVAHADDEFSAEEQETIVGLVRAEFGLSPAEAGELIALAEEERRESTDLFQFTRLIGKDLDRSGKLAVVESLWRVVYSDGTLEAHEDALLHKLGRLLDLRHNDLIALKLKVKGG